MIIYPYGKKNKALLLPPHTQIRSMRLNNDMVSDLLCDTAWTDPLDMLKHHWISNRQRGDKIEVVKMDLLEYLVQHKMEIPSMNPIAGMQRLDFLSAYGEKWDVTMKLIGRIR